MAGFISDLVNWAGPRISKFLSGASEFIGMTPKYIDNNGLNKMFTEEMKTNTAEMIKKYGDTLGLADDAIENFNYKDFSKLSKNQKGEILQNYRKDVAETVRNKNAFNALDYEKFDPGSQKHLDSIRRTYTTDGFKEKYFQHQLDLGEKGIFGDKFSNFDLSDGRKNLNKEQLGALSDYFDSEYVNKVAKFEDLYTPTGMPDIGPKPQLNYNVGLQKRYLGTKEGKQQLHLLGGMSMNKGNKSESIIDAAIRKNADDAGTLNAYKEYLNKGIIDTPGIKGRWEAPKSFEEWATEQAIEDSEIKRISKEIAFGDPDHSGIDIWGMAKRHPVIATSIVMGTTFGISELTEDDSL